MISTNASLAGDPAEWVDKFGDDLFRYARSRVCDDETAEDLVQETFLSAIYAAKDFTGGSTVRTWLIAILKHKVIDHYRQAVKFVELDDNPSGDEYFDAAGHWRNAAAPAEWNRMPDAVVAEAEFATRLFECLRRMPKHLAAVFILHEIEGLTSTEVCEQLSVTPANYWVMLHRSRLFLRKHFEAVSLHIQAAPARIAPALAV